MAKFKCGPERGGRKVCTRPNGSKISLRVGEATAGTKAKRRGAAKRLNKYRFTKADAKACARHKNRKVRGKCMAARVEGRL